MNSIQLVGILNLTPDSFSGDGLVDADTALDQAKQMFADGASLIDIGAESTRPGATVLDSNEEWTRLEPVVTEISSLFPGKFSIDSYHPATVELAAGAVDNFILNDVTGFNNPAMVKLAAMLNQLTIISHLPTKLGQDIQAGHQQENKIDSVQQVVDELMTTRQKLINSGVKAENIILDPGIGFGKTIETNWQLLKFASLVPGQPVMIGYSKKSFLGEERMTVARNLEAGHIAVDFGAKYLRLHADLLVSHRQEFITDIKK